jgi:phage repressor protein C with HTH and peptisase S24 domain
MEFKDRLKAARKHAKLNQAELAKASGLTQTSISDLERGKSKGTAFVAQLALACGVDTMWLAEGKGEMISGLLGDDAAAMGASSADIVREMLRKHGKGLSEKARQRIQSAAEEQSESAPVRGNVITADFSRPGLVGDEIKIPHYDVRAAMGGGQIPADYIELLRDVTVSQEHLRRLGVDYESPFHLKMITGWGQSMEPTIQDKDPLLIDVSIEEFTGDGIYLFTQGEMLFIKRLQLEDEKRLKVISDNRNHDPRFVTSDDIYIKGRILLVWNAHRV